MITDIRGTIAFINSKSEKTIFRPCINLIVHCTDKDDMNTELQLKYRIESGKLVAAINDLYNICLRVFSSTTRNYIDWWLETVKDLDGYYLRITYIFLDGSDKFDEKWICEYY